MATRLGKTMPPQNLLSRLGFPLTITQEEKRSRSIDINVAKSRPRSHHTIFKDALSDPLRTASKRSPATFPKLMSRTFVPAAQSFWRGESSPSRLPNRRANTPMTKNARGTTALWTIKAINGLDPAWGGSLTVVSHCPHIDPDVSWQAV